MPILAVTQYPLPVGNVPGTLRVRYKAANGNPAGQWATAQVLEPQGPPPPAGSYDSSAGESKFTLAPNTAPEDYETAFLLAETADTGFPYTLPISLA